MISCLSSGLAKYNKFIKMFVLFSRAFLGHFEGLPFFENGGTNFTPKQSNMVFLVNFSKIQQLNNNFTKSAANLTKGVLFWYPLFSAGNS